MFGDSPGDGGNVTHVGRINVDAGVLNPELLTPSYGPAVARVWAKARLRDRIDAIIIHELAESQTGDHAEALKLALETERPINEATRQILRAMESGWKGRGP